MFGSFDAGYAGGTLEITLDHTGPTLSVSLKVSDESSKGLETAEALTVAVTVAAIERFTAELRALHAIKAGFAHLL